MSYVFGKSDEVIMRMLRLISFAGAILVVTPATAQLYNSHNPVCLQQWEWGGSYTINCDYTSWDQCQVAASGLGAMCLVNPYWSQARQVSPRRGALGRAR